MECEAMVTAAKATIVQPRHKTRFKFILMFPLDRIANLLETSFTACLDEA